MAINVVTWVLYHSKSTLAARLVLIAIADNAGDDGDDAYPSVATIAHKARVGERTVQESIPKLVELGELEVSYNTGPRGTNRYRVIMNPPQNPRPPAESAPSDAGNGSPQTSDPDGCASRTPAHPAPPQNSAENPAGSAPEPSLNRPSTDATTSHLSAERATSRRRKNRRTPDEQVRFEQASDIANRWWKHRQEGGVIVGEGFVGLRDRVILAALRGGATVRQVENALVACNTTIPSVQQFEKALRGELPNGHRNGYQPPLLDYDSKEFGGGYTFRSA